MPNPDPYLRPGLTPNTDVELYASAAAGGTTTPITASTTAIGVASVSKVVTRTFATVSVGTVSSSRTATLARTFAGTAVGTASASLATVRAGTFSATATGTPAESHVVIPNPTPTPAPSAYGSVHIRRTVRHVIRASTTARGRASMRFTVDRTGRRRAEDELLLVGAI